jgi:GntR family transcriptional regulator
VSRNRHSVEQQNGSAGGLPDTISIDLNSEVPIYVQLKNQLKLLIESGRIVSGEQLPTVRELALSLSINANTVSRVYSDLAREGYATLRKGVGTFAAGSSEGGAELPGLAQLREVLQQLRALGYSPRQIMDMAAEMLYEEQR